MNPQLVSDLVDIAAERWADRTAVTDGKTTLTYRELRDESVRLADWLAGASPLTRGDRLVVAAPASTLIVALLFAAARTGTTFVPLHEQVTGFPLAHVLDDCEPRLLVTDTPEDRRLAGERGIPALGVSDLATLAVASPPEPRRRPISVDPACLIYTSGTTSLPKAVVSTHQQMLYATDAIQSVLAYRSDDVIYCALPLSFDYGLYQVLLAARSGAAVCLGRSVEAGALLLRGLRRSGATVFPAVPPLAEVLVRMLDRPGSAPPKLRLVTNTGAAIAGETVASLRAAIPGLTVQLMYGLTECKRVAIMPPNADLRHPGSCGLPLPGTEVLVVNDAGEPVMPGEIGEFVVRGPHVMAGYWRRPELTAQRFPRRVGLFPELRTGDYGYLDDAGYLHFSGRRDDLYKERGFRVSTTEIEAAARRVNGVTTAVVLPPEADRSAILVVVSELAPEHVLGELRSYVEPYKIPRRCVVLNELPVTPNGKVDRTALVKIAEEVHHAGQQSR